MTFLLMALLFLDGNVSAEPEDWFIKDPELFQVILKRDAHVTPTGETLLLNFGESRVQLYGADGQFKKNIGQRGKGPGEFNFATYMTVVDDVLYIQDILTSLVSAFKLDGTFIKHYKLSDRNLKVMKTVGGWFYWMEGFTERGPADIYFAKDAPEEGKVVHKVKDMGWSQGTWVMNNNGQVRATFSPLHVRPKTTVSPDGRYFLITDTYKFEIHIFDGTTGEKVRTIKRDDKPIPFDKEWADEEFEEGQSASDRQHKFEKLYPETFPAIRELDFDPDGNLVVSRWRGRPDKNYYPITFNLNGKEQPNRYEWNTLRRYLGKANGKAYVMMFEEEEDAGVVLVPFKDMNDFVKKHPITDWSVSRSISISD